MARATHDDVSGFTLDATNYLTTMIDGSISVEHEMFDATVVGDIDDSQCARRKSARFEVNLKSNDANCTVSGLNVTALTIDSVDMKAYCESLNFDVQNNLSDVSGVADVWSVRQFLRRTITASGTFFINTDAATEDGLILDAWSSTLSNLNMVVAFTINSVGFSIPMMVSSATHRWSRNDNQMWELSFVQRGAATLPSGTSTLLEKALNTPGTPQALVLESKADGGLNYSGNFLVDRFGFAVNKQDAILTSYSYVSTGEVTITATTGA